MVETASFSSQTGMNPESIVVLRCERAEPVVSFADAIKDAATLPGRVYWGDDPIILDGHQAFIEEVRTFTLEDSRHKEAVRLFDVSRDFSIVVSDLIIGKEDEVRFRFRTGVQNGSVAHTHPRDQIYSQKDLIDILSYDNRGTTSELLLTPERTLLLFRGPRTPYFKDPLREINKMTKGIVGFLERQVRNGETEEFEDEAERDKIIFRVLAELLDFQVFEGAAGEAVLRKVKPHEIAR